MVNYKLTYFNIRGTAEVSRQIFAYSGQKFEDQRVTRKQWQKMRYDMPFHHLPVLYFDQKPLAQSHAIARYLAREFGINGKSSWEEAQVNSLADQFKDYQAEIHPYFLAKNGIHPGDTETLYHEVFQPTFKKNYEFFTRFLKETGSGFLVGDSLTWVDLLVAQNSSTVEFDGLKEFPEMEEHQKRIHRIPRIKYWLENHEIKDSS